MGQAIGERLNVSRARGGSLPERLNVVGYTTNDYPLVVPFKRGTQLNPEDSSFAVFIDYDNRANRRKPFPYLVPAHWDETAASYKVPISSQTGKPETINTGYYAQSNASLGSFLYGKIGAPAHSALAVHQEV